MQGDCRKQLDHIKQRVEPGLVCLAGRGSAHCVNVLLVANAAILKQTGYGLQFTTISEAGIMSLMRESRNVALHAAHVASTEPRDLTGAPRDLHGLGLTNWHTINMINQLTMLNHMLNDEGRGDLHCMTLTEMREVSQQTGTTWTMTTFPCYPSKTPWWADSRPPILGTANMDRNG